MAERTDLIEQHIEVTRHQLGNNLHELEDKVKQAADWRTYYERNPMMMVGLAFGGGVMLASMLSGRSERPDAPTAQTPKSAAGYLTGATQRDPISETWQNMKTALIGLTGAKIRSLLDDAIPGFSEHYVNATRENPAPSPKREYETPTHRM